MSHQDRMSCIVVNVDAGVVCRDRGANWKPRMLAVAAMLWATGELTNLGDRFDRARKIVGKIFRWQIPPGETYQGFMKMLRKWHVRLLLAITPHIRARVQGVSPGRFEIAGFVAFAGGGRRIELACTQSLEDAFSPQRKKNARKKTSSDSRHKQRKSDRARRSAAQKVAAIQSDDSISRHSTA